MLLGRRDRFSLASFILGRSGKHILLLLRILFDLANIYEGFIFALLVDFLEDALRVLITEFLILGSSLSAVRDDDLVKDELLNDVFLESKLLELKVVEPD